MRGAALIVVLLGAAAALGELRAYAMAPSHALRQAEDRFSPLYPRRLEVGLRNMDQAPGKIRVAAGQRFISDPVATPLSANPLSVCVGSGCTLSVCMGSACAGSWCLGSACQASGCLGSACIMSGCGGSACLGSGCFGSTCLGSGCMGSVCVKCAAGPEPADTEAWDGAVGGETS